MKKLLIALHLIKKHPPMIIKRVIIHNSLQYESFELQNAYEKKIK